MIRHAFRILNDTAIVFPAYGSGGDIPPGSLARRYHSRFQIKADGVFVFPAYDTVGGSPPPPTGTLARRFHSRLRIYNSPFSNVIVFPAYGVQAAHRRAPEGLVPGRRRRSRDEEDIQQVLKALMPYITRKRR